MDTLNDEVGGPIGGVLVSPEVATLIERAARSFEADPRSARDYIRRASALLRAERVARQISAQISLAVRPHGGLAPWQIKRVMAYIDAHSGSQIRAADLAALARLSTSHFNRSFKISVGVPPFSYITSKRIEVACDLLANSRDELCDIAMACGMADQSHFCRVFRKFVGVSPGAWRRTHFDGAPEEPASRRSGVGAALAGIASQTRAPSHNCAVR